MTENLQGVMQFIDSSVTCYHAVCETEKKLIKAGFEKLSEAEVWDLKKGGYYYLIRNDSSIMAFKVPEGDIKGFRIYAAHSDSPSFKIKEHPEMDKEGTYVSINTEKYGGMILSTWLDRPLSIAGRVCVSENDKIMTYPVRLKDNLCVIPNLAIHMNREINSGYNYNPQVDMLPLITMKDDKKTINSMVIDQINSDFGKNLDEKDVLASDLFIVNCEKCVVAGANDEFLMAPRYDDLGCVYGGLAGLLKATPSNYIDILAIFDNEEVGSLTRQGADSTLLRDTLANISDGLGQSDRILRTWIADSFLLSADNAHACHPNQAGKADPTNKPFLNKGIVLKYHGSQKYATDAFSAAFVKKLCQSVGTPVQTFANRSDLVGGSTLGNLAMAQVSMASADIGLPQLAMHSSYETAGAKDIDYLVEIATKFFE